MLLLIAIALVISGWWHVIIYLSDSQAAKEITAKEVSNWNSYNVRPFYYYWNFFIQSGTWTIVAFVGLFYPYLKDRVFHRRGYTFTVIWTLASVILLSFIPEKKSRYLLPVLIPLAMNTAFYLEYLFRISRTHALTRWEKIPVWFQFGLIGTVGVLVPFGGYWYLGNQLEGNWVWFILLSISLFVLGLLIFIALRKNRIARAFYMTLAFMVALVIFGLPLSDSLSTNPQYRGFSHLRSWQDSTGLAVYEFEEGSPEMIWDYGMPMPVLKNGEQGQFPPQGTFGVVAFEELETEVREYFTPYRVQKIGYFDVNPRGREQGGHKDRLYRDFYLITKD